MLAELALLEVEEGHPTKCDEALRALGSLASPDAETKCRTLYRVSMALSRLGRSSESAAARDEAHALALQVGFEDVASMCLLQLGLAKLRGADPIAAGVFVDDALRRARAGGHREPEIVALRLLGVVRDDPNLIEESIQLARDTGMLRLELISRQMWLKSLWDRGDHERARREADSLAIAADRCALRQLVRLVAMQRAEWALADGDRAGVLEQRDAMVSAGARGGAQVERLGLRVLDIAEALIRDDRASASELAASLVRDADGFADPDFLRLVELVKRMAPAEVRDGLEALS
jgi:hypothetical protein